MSLNVTVYAGSDWAGCANNRKGALGVLCCALGTAISALSRTQQALALSSGEAELSAVGHGVAERFFLGHSYLKVT